MSAQQSMVFSIALHFLRNETLAEEIAQDVFLELYRVIGALSTPEHMRAWLRRTTLHRCIDESRRKAYRLELPLTAADRHGKPDNDRDFLAYEQLRQEVTALPEIHRAVVILRYQEEMEPMEIAALLDIPVNTVKSRLHRALHALRERIERRTRLRA